MLAYLSLNKYLDKFVKEKNKKMYDKVASLIYKQKLLWLNDYFSYGDWENADKNIAFEYIEKMWKGNNAGEQVACLAGYYRYTKDKDRKEIEKFLDRFQKLVTQKKSTSSKDMLRNIYLNYRAWIEDFEKQKDFKNAEYYYEKSLNLVNLFGNEYDIFFWERKMILFYQKYGFDEKALQLAKKHFQHKDYNGFSLIYNFCNHSNNLKHQFEVLNMAYELAEKEKNQFQQENTLQFLTQKWKLIYNRAENKDEIKKYLNTFKMHPTIKDWYSKNVE